MNIQFIQLTDLWHVLQVTLTDIKPGKSIKKKEKKYGESIVKALFKLKRSCKNFKMLKIE